jgi:transposase
VISEAQRAEIRRLYYAEHWRIGTIASQLGLHPDSVRGAIEAARFGTRSVVRPSPIDPYLDFVRLTLDQYPRLRATRIHEMIAARGFAGSVQLTRRCVRRLRPRPPAEAFLRLHTLPGEQAQVDWGHFGSLQVGRATRSLSAFVMVLSWSRAIHVLFTLDQSLESFLRGHVEAFAYFEGAARTLLYDNLKSAVLARQGSTIEFHPRLLELSGHYHFRPQPCAVARGNEKGRVERQIRFLRERFFAARAFRDVDDLNAQFLRWRDDWAHARAHPEFPEKTVAEVLLEERPRLLPLPEHPFECERVLVRHSGKTPYLRFEGNDYSIPPALVKKPLTLVATPTEIRILDGFLEVSRFARCYDRGQCFEDPKHLDALLASKHAARPTKRRDWLRAALPHAGDFFEAALARGLPLASTASRLRRLLAEYGPEKTDAALLLTLDRGTPTPDSVAHWLEQERRRASPLPRIPLELPDRKPVRDLHVTPHDLETYDALARSDSDSGASED